MWPFKKKKDEFEEARLNAAMECFKRGKSISGTMYSDGTIEIKEEQDEKVNRSKS